MRKLSRMSALIFASCGCCKGRRNFLGRNRFLLALDAEYLRRSRSRKKGPKCDLRASENYNNSNATDSQTTTKQKTETICHKLERSEEKQGRFVVDTAAAAAAAAAPSFHSQEIFQGRADDDDDKVKLKGAEVYAFILHAFMLLDLSIDIRIFGGINSFPSFTYVYLKENPYFRLSRSNTMLLNGC